MPLDQLIAAWQSVLSDGARRSWLLPLEGKYLAVEKRDGTRSLP
jgi:hypothetical protein